MPSRKQRKAISQAQIAKRCKPLGDMVRGHRAYWLGVDRSKCPYNDPEKRQAWMNGWDMAEQKDLEIETLAERDDE